MKLSSGWIKLYRQLQDCWIWLDKEPFDKRSAWVDLLLTANHSDKKILFNGELITIKRGQILTSVRKLSVKWKWSVNKVYRFLKLLENDEMLQKESDKDRTLLTIENYSIFQCCEYTNENSNGNTNGNNDEYTSETPAETPTNTPTEHKQEDNNDKNNNICSNSDDLNESDKPKKKTKLTEEENEELVKNFEIIYNSYPKKVGKASGFKVYKQWLNGRNIDGTKIKLTNRQMWYAIAKYKHYIEKEEMEPQYIKQFDTFMRNILDYVEDEQQ